jgi:hypothetical protein
MNDENSAIRASLPNNQILHTAPIKIIARQRQRFQLAGSDRLGRRCSRLRHAQRALSLQVTLVGVAARLQRGRRLLRKNRSSQGQTT